VSIPIPAKDKARVQDALRDPDASDVYFSLDIDGLQVGDRITDGRWGADTSGAIATDVNFTGVLSLDYDDTPSNLSVSVGGVPIPQMAGYVSLPTVNEDKVSTQFLAASAGAEAGRVTLDALVEEAAGVRAIQFPGWTPDSVLRVALGLLPYPSNMVEIDLLKEPLLYLDLAHRTNFWPEQHVSDILSVISNQTAYTLRDTALGGFVASPTLEIAQIAAGERVYNASDFLKWRRPPRKSRRYSHVVVYKRNDTGMDVFPPAVAVVPYRRTKRPALKDTGLYISIDDQSPQAPERARRLASQMASKLANGSFGDDSATLPYFDPTIEIQDVLWVDEDSMELDGAWSRSWMLWVNTYSHNKVDLTTEIGYTAALIEEEHIKAPTAVMPGISDGIVSWPGDAIGSDNLGFWYRDNVALKDGVPWIGLDETGAFVDPALSSERTGYTSSGFWFEF
jgi:hypothetical protein